MTLLSSHTFRVLASLCVSFAFIAPVAADHNGVRTRVRLSVFQASGNPDDFGGGGLLPGGQNFPDLPMNAEVPGSRAVLTRTKKCLEYRVKTNGLPEGAYTNWWVITNQPGNCAVANNCTIDDVFNPATDSAVFWATGNLVGADGVGRFSDRVCKGQDLGFPFTPASPLSRCAPGAACGPGLLIGGQHLAFLPGDVTNTRGAAVWVIVKYHGATSDDPVTLYDQLYTLLGSCWEGANAVGPGDGTFNCFDPQYAIFPAPADDD